MLKRYSQHKFEAARECQIAIAKVESTFPDCGFHTTLLRLAREYGGSTLVGGFKVLRGIVKWRLVRNFAGHHPVARGATSLAICEINVLLRGPVNGNVRHPK